MQEGSSSTKTVYGRDRNGMPSAATVKVVEYPVPVMGHTFPAFKLELRGHSYLSSAGFGRKSLWRVYADGTEQRVL